MSVTAASLLRSPGFFDKMRFSLARLNGDGVPASFKGAPMVLLGAALISIAFMGFSGIAG